MPEKIAAQELFSAIKNYVEAKCDALESKIGSDSSDSMCGMHGWRQTRDAEAELKRVIELFVDSSKPIEPAVDRPKFPGEPRGKPMTSPCPPPKNR